MIFIPRLIPGSRRIRHRSPVKRTVKRQPQLPIGRTARIAFEIDAMRGECCKAAQGVIRNNEGDECDLEECARLDDALAQAHRILKRAVRDVMLNRLNRRSRTK